MILAVKNYFLLYEKDILAQVVLRVWRDGLRCSASTLE